MMPMTRRLLMACACGLLAAGPTSALLAQPQMDPLVARGEYLAKIGGCAGCHTAPKGSAPFAGGRAVPVPGGAIYSTNITPDRRYGIGRYSLDDFARAVREGSAQGDKPLYPAMPYVSYARMSDEDVRALYVYLQTAVAPVALATPRNRLPFPLNQRWALRMWKLIFVPKGTYATQTGKDAEWNRGAYLVQTLGHCGTCHTPRSFAFQERGHDESSKKFLAGAVNNHWFAPNLTGDTGSGLGRLDAAAIAAFLKTGHGGGLIAYGPMAEEIEQSLQYMRDDDLRAVARYLKTLPAQGGSGTYTASHATVRTAAKGNRSGDVESTGAAAYRGFCARCHQADGKGVPQAFPRLAGNPSVLSEDATSLIRIVLEGGRGPATAAAPPHQEMPPFADTLTDVQIAEVLSHVREAWGNDARPVTTSDVDKLRRALRK